jgi:hypothetical protein
MDGKQKMIFREGKDVKHDPVLTKRKHKKTLDAGQA